MSVSFSTYQTKYMEIWYECIAQGFTTQDARDYAEMECEALGLSIKRSKGCSTPNFLKKEEEALAIIRKSTQPAQELEIVEDAALNNVIPFPKQVSPLKCEIIGPKIPEGFNHVHPKTIAQLVNSVVIREEEKRENFSDMGKRRKKGKKIKVKESIKKVPDNHPLKIAMKGVVV